MEGVGQNSSVSEIDLLHLFKLLPCTPHLIQDVAKAVHVQGGQTGDAFQAQGLGTVTGLDTKEEAGGTADNCTAIPGESINREYRLGPWEPPV